MNPQEGYWLNSRKQQLLTNRRLHTSQRHGLRTPHGLLVPTVKHDQLRSGRGRQTRTAWE